MLPSARELRDLRPNKSFINLIKKMLMSKKTGPPPPLQYGGF